MLYYSSIWERFFIPSRSKKVQKLNIWMLNLYFRGKIKLLIYPIWRWISKKIFLINSYMNKILNNFQFWLLRQQFLIYVKLLLIEMKIKTMAMVLKGREKEHTHKVISHITICWFLIIIYLKFGIKEQRCKRIEGLKKILFYLNNISWKQIKWIVLGWKDSFVLNFLIYK
jgi:hypothetical protein